MKKRWNNPLFLRVSRKNENKVIGILNPIRWDKAGRVRQFSIYSDSEEDIIIEGYRNREKLKKLLNKRILATGQVRTNEYGEKFIKLKKIDELTGPSSPAVSLIRPPDIGFWNEEYSLMVPREYALNQYGRLSEVC